jgi:hypothetical protein
MGRLKRNLLAENYLTLRKLLPKFHRVKSRIALYLKEGGKTASFAVSRREAPKREKTLYFFKGRFTAIW